MEPIQIFFSALLSSQENTGYLTLFVLLWLISMAEQYSDSNLRSEAQYISRLNKSLPMKYAKQFYCLVTLSSEAVA